MIQSIAGLIEALQAEAAALEQQIISFRNGTVGSHLAPAEKSAEIARLIDSTAEVTALVTEFIQYGDLPVAFPREGRDEPEAVVRRRYRQEKIATAEPA